MLNPGEVFISGSLESVSQTEAKQRRLVFVRHRQGRKGERVVGKGSMKILEMGGGPYIQEAHDGRHLPQAE